MLEIRNVSKSFGKKKVLDGVNLTVGEMSVYGLIGYNGAGKTTLLKMITDVYKRDDGEILFNGEDLANNAGMKEKIFYVPDDLFFKVGSTMKSMAKFYAGYYPNFDMETFRKLTELFGLNEKAKIHSFSKGMQRQAEMILGLSAKPDLLLLDESFDGLDPSKRNLMKKLLLEFMAERNAAVLISSHNLKELADMCDHIALMNGNKIELDVSVDDATLKRLKVRLVFSDDVTDEFLTGCGFYDIDRDGKIINASFDGTEDEAREGLGQTEPILFETKRKTLEEIFIDKMGGTDYDLEEIFK